MTTTNSKTPTISAVAGNSQWLDGGAMFGNAPRAVWERWLPPDAHGRVELACRGMLIEWSGKRFLCETGIGVFFPPKLAERYGVTEDKHRLLLSLNSLGLSDSDIDYVILSHLHFDHAGGLLPSFAEIEAGNKGLLFPRAKYVVGKEALARAENPHPRDRASFIPDLAEKLRNSGRLMVVDGEHDSRLYPERIHFRYSEGHTPGHMHTVFQGEHHQVVFAGDLVPGTAWVHLPITMGYDRFAEKVIDEKAALYQNIVPLGSWLFYTHDAKVAMSKVTTAGDGKFVAAEPQAHEKLIRFAF